MAAIDRKPERRKPIVVAGDCALRGETEAAATIRDLLDLAKSLDCLNQAYRVGNSGAAPGKAIDRIHALRWMIG